MRLFQLIFSVIFIPLFFLQGCSTTKYLNKEDFLLGKNDLKTTPETSAISTKQIEKMIAQKPNTKILGVPFPLLFYSMGNQNYEQSAINWVKNHPKTVRFISRVFSQKQTIGLLNSYQNFHQWILKTGESPVIFKEDATKNSVRKIKAYLFNKGFFNARVTYKKLPNIKKQNVFYDVKLNRPYFLDTIKTDIDNPVIKAIYEANKSQSFLKRGDRYDDDNFIKEANRLTRLFRDNGIYYFYRDDVRFYDIDTLAVNQKTNVRIVIKDPVKNNPQNKDRFKPYTINKVNVFTDFVPNMKDTLHWHKIFYEGINFYRKNKRMIYRPKILHRQIAFEHGQLYQDSSAQRTKNLLQYLRNFKYTSIQYTPSGDAQFDVNIFVNPLKKYDFRFNAEVINSNIKQIGLSGLVAVSDKNLFKGAEMFSISLQGSIFRIANQAQEKLDFLDVWEINANMSLEVPRIWFPFISGIFTSVKSPQTYFSNTLTVQKKIGLDRQRFTSLLSYRWKPNDNVKHQVDLFNVEYVRNLNADSYFDVYFSEYQKLKDIATQHFSNNDLLAKNPLGYLRQKIALARASENPIYHHLENILARRNIITADYIIPSVGYSFLYSNQAHLKDYNHTFFSARFQFSKSPIADNVYRNVNIAQFTKIDLNYKKFWQQEKAVWAFRFFVGVALPIENSDIPFLSSYFAGGTNDVRAWQAYDLGPGGSANNLEFKIANFKLLTSLEYRFRLFKKMQGALFIDAGNIWNIDDLNFTESKEKLQQFSDLANIAVGSGFGFRYDFSFLLLRLDVAFKTYEPYLSGDKWFQNYDFSNFVWNVGFNYPF